MKNVWEHFYIITESAGVLELQFIVYRDGYTRGIYFKSIIRMYTYVEVYMQMV